MATNKKAKHAIATAITANTEQPAAIPEHPQPVPVTPECSNRSTVTGKHPRDVTETKQDTHKTCPIGHTTWAAWKAAPTFPIRVTITNLTLGGGKFEKKPSWMLLTPVNDNETRQYSCWDRVPLEKLNVSVGQICNITGLQEVPAFSRVAAFIQNYESRFECNGTLTIRNQTDINAEYTPIPLLTAFLGASKKTEYLFYVLLLYTWEQFTQPARYPTASEGTAGHRVLRGLRFST